MYLYCSEKDGDFLFNINSGNFFNVSTGQKEVISDEERLKNIQLSLDFRYDMRENVNLFVERVQFFAVSPSLRNYANSPLHVTGYYFNNGFDGMSIYRFINNKEEFLNNLVFMVGTGDGRHINEIPFGLLKFKSFF